MKYDEGFKKHAFNAWISTMIPENRTLLDPRLPRYAKWPPIKIYIALKYTFQIECKITMLNLKLQRREVSD